MLPRWLMTYICSNLDFTDEREVGSKIYDKMIVLNKIYDKMI